MIKLLQIEYKKLLPYSTFWVLFGLFFVFVPVVFYGAGQIKIEGFPVDFSTMYNFPNVWNNLTYIGSWFNLLIGMLLVILVCNEFTFKTFRQQVINGNSKADFVLSKILLMLSFSLIATTYLFFLGAIFGISTGGGNIFVDIKYLFVYFIQSLGYMSVGLIIAVLLRSSALSIILFVCSIIVESMIRALIPDNVDQFFPMKIISNLTPIPGTDVMMNEISHAVATEISLNITLLIAIVYIVAFWGVSYFVLSRRDIR